MWSLMYIFHLGAMRATRTIHDSDKLIVAVLGTSYRTVQALAGYQSE